MPIFDFCIIKLFIHSLSFILSWGNGAITVKTVAAVVSNASAADIRIAVAGHAARITVTTK